MRNQARAVAVDCGFEHRIPGLGANIVGQFPDEIAEIGRKLRPQTCVTAGAANHALQVAECILAQRGGFRALGGNDETFDPRRLLAEPQGCSPGLGQEVLRRCQQFSVQCGSSRQLDSAREKTAL